MDQYMREYKFHLLLSSESGRNIYRMGFMIGRAENQADETIRELLQEWLAKNLKKADLDAIETIRKAEQKASEEEAAEEEAAEGPEWIIVKEKN